MHRYPTATSICEGAFTVLSVLSESECREHIARAERLGFGDAPVNLGGGIERRIPDLRNNQRAMVDDWDLAHALYKRVRSALPKSIAGWELSGLNERFRYYRYGPGQYFRWHRDGPFERSDGERSLLSALFYLTDDFSGGATELDLVDEQLSVRPSRGTLLVFSHQLLHQGAPVASGIKYIARTDVMYRRV